MDFLKSAVASAISKGPAFPYSFGDRVDIEQSTWTLHNGTKREDGSRCSIFSFDINANKSRLPLARNALRKLRTLRHPGVIKVLDTVETDTYIYIATERLTPLGWHIRRKSLAEETIKWGLYGIAKTLKFINGEAASVHGCIRASSIFTCESGEWKLGGFDILSSMKEDDAVIYSHASLVTDNARYAPPEVAKGGWDVIRRHPLTAVDAYNFGTLIFEVCNGGFTSADQAGQTKNIPPSMHQSYKRLVNANPKTRLSVGQFLEQGQRHGGFFQTPLIQLSEGIENLGLKNETEREEFLEKLDQVSDDFPEDFFKMKVLPELLKSVEFGGGGARVFGVVMRISKKLSDDEYEAQITPVIVRLFALPDRAIRVCLLDNLPLIIDHLPAKLVNDKIFPQMVTGFSDIAPVVREQTVKAVLAVVPKLSDRTVNGELLRYLAKTANDEQPGIRTNTTICLGKIARNLGTGTRTKVLVAAFSRSLRDPFVHARNAALMALAATADVFSEEDAAAKILPAVCPSLVDKEKIVRDQANKTLDIYLSRIRKHQQTLPETSLPPTPSATSTSSTQPRIGTAQADSSSWAGWAISSFTNKLSMASGEITTAAPSQNGGIAPRTSTSSENRSHSVPPSLTAKNSSSTSLRPPYSGLIPDKKSASSNPFVSPSPSQPASEGDFEDFGAWDDEAPPDPISSPTSDPFTAASAAAPSVDFDDKGEPDFAGWLAAKDSAKRKVTKPLPKGLGKSSKAASRPTIGAKSASYSAKPAASTSSKAEKTTPAAAKNEEEDDQDAWDSWQNE